MFTCLGIWEELLSIFYIMIEYMYSNLNGLRSIAMVCILIMHVCAMSDSVGGMPGSFHVEQWGDFVFLLMLLSSFSMCCGYKDKLLNGDINIIHFYKRRVMRIFPFLVLWYVLICFLNTISIHFVRDSRILHYYLVSFQTHKCMLLVLGGL